MQSNPTESDAVETPPLVLVVEDAEDLLEAYGILFAARGWRTVSATNGGTALALAVAARPDVIVLDLGLPIVSGWDIIRRLKTDIRTSRIPVIAVTGDDRPAARAQALATGVDRYILKPCRPDLLLAEIQRWLTASSH